MAVDTVAETFRNPLGVTADEEGDSTVKVTVVLPGMKKKALKNELANGTVEVKFGTRTLEARVTMVQKVNGKKKSENFRYQVKKLPDEIVPEKCRHKVEKDKLILILHKVQARTWAAELDQNGLEMDRDDEAGDN